MGQLTVLQQINIAKVSEYLSGNDVANGSLFGARLDPRLPRMIYTERKSLEWLYNLSNDDPSLLDTGNYVYALCGRYAIQAQAIINGSSGGGTIIPGTGQQNIYPFYITSDNFNTDGTTYSNANMKPTDSITIFINEYSQQWMVASDTTFQRTADGFEILLPGWNASTQYWTMLVDKLNS